MIFSSRGVLDGGADEGGDRLRGGRATHFVLDLDELLVHRIPLVLRVRNAVVHHGTGVPHELLGLTFGERLLFGVLVCVGETGGLDQVEPLRGGIGTVALDRIDENVEASGGGTRELVSRVVLVELLARLALCFLLAVGLGREALARCRVAVARARDGGGGIEQWRIL